MLLHIPAILSPTEVAEMRQQLDAAHWLDGRQSAGAQASRVKHNQQLDPTSPLAQRLGQRIAQALAASPMFTSAALPLRSLPALFNRYEGGGQYGLHVDAALMAPQGGGERLRSDVSSTLFLCEPDEYDGGELVIMDSYGSHEVKLPAGDLILYPSTSLHQVLPVTRGARVCAFFWTQSMVREDAKRSMLYELDTTIQTLRQTATDEAPVLALTQHYHNLLRLWADV